jgi:hypothetical protein
MAIGLSRVAPGKQTPAFQCVLVRFAAIAKGERTDIRLTHKVPVAWVYLTGWATRDNVIHFRDDVYGHDDKPTLVADARAQVASAARASGFLLQSADTRSSDVKPVSYLDSQ